MAVPLVSVLMTVRDAEHTLAVALRSIDRQTLVDIEVVVVDDGSLDRSGEILDSWAKRDARIRPVHIARCGLVGALNAGLGLCRAPLVARMDADDVSHPRRLETQRQLLIDHRDIGVVSCLVRHFPWRLVGEGNRLYEGWLNALVDAEEIARGRFVESPVAHPSVMVRRRLLEDAGGYRDLGWPEDYDLWLRLLEAGVRFEKVPHLFFFWRDHAHRLTRTDSRYSKHSFLACKAHFLLRGPLAGAPPVILWGAGRTGRDLSRHLLATGVDLRAAVDIDPRKIGGALRGVPVVAAGDLPGMLSPATVVLVAVASRGARELIRPRLEALGLEEGSSFWCVA